ncbi:hypothetical protein EHS25_005393 [Saitozyma podzolica]|uniref:NodB homology domain-containing protein n=1 Tax=Saitozyma podzolica TaxID=1890683 RepID=A0A427XY14_9TREE|nr:hypothetical protein EHS25_005393 [Saitozyma podzolica]
MSSVADEYGPRNIVGYGQNPPDAKWPGGAKIAISIVLNYEEGSEASPMNGDPQSEKLCSELGPGCEALDGRNVNIESLYEYGSRAGVWRILRLFKEYGVTCTSYMVGQALLMNPEVGRVMVQEGHEVASHGWRWVDRSGWSEEEEVENVRQAITAASGWYYGMVQTKAGARSRGLVARTYAEEGLPLKYYSDDYSDDLPYWVKYPGSLGKQGEGAKGEEGLLIVPYALDTNDYKDGAHNAWLTPDNFASYLIGAFDELYREGLAGSPKMFSIGLHCRLIGRPGRLAGLRKFLEHTRKYEGVWFATREEIADHWKETYPYETVGSA